MTGSWLGASFQGHGYGTEQRAAVLELAFRGLGANAAISGALEHNIASQRVSTKLGYRQTGTSERSPGRAGAALRLPARGGRVAQPGPSRARRARFLLAALRRIPPFGVGRWTLFVAKRTADANSMRLFLRERVTPLFWLVGVGAVLPAALLAVWGDRMVMLGTQWHFTGVGVTALVAAFAALALTVVGIRRKDGRVILLGTAFTVMAALLAIHGLATPGVIVGYNGVLALTGAATLPAGAAILALSALPPLRRPHSINALLWLEAASLVAVIGLGVVGLGFPGVVPDVPAPRSPGAIAALIIGMSLFGILILRALKTYMLTRRGVDLAVVIGVA